MFLLWDHTAIALMTAAYVLNECVQQTDTPRQGLPSETQAMHVGSVVSPSTILATTELNRSALLRQHIYLHDGSALYAHTLGRRLGLASNHGLDLCRQILLPVLCAAPAVMRTYAPVAEPRLRWKSAQHAHLTKADPIF